MGHSHDVTVLIPVALPMEKDRWMALRYVRDFWKAENLHVHWAIQCDDGPWNKSRLINTGLAEVQTDYVVITDADIVIPGIGETIEAIRAGKAVYARHGFLLRLNHSTTQAILNDHPSADELCFNRHIPREYLDEPMTKQNAGQPPIVGITEALRSIPMDERFVGWGGEDVSWGKALDCLIDPDEWGTTEKRWNSRLDVVHLWHEPQPERGKSRNDTARIWGENGGLWREYEHARSRPAAMRRLLEGART